jgi:hypothetical protein
MPNCLLENLKGKREEKLLLQAVLDASQTGEYVKEVNEILEAKNGIVVREGDSLRLTYTVFIEYWDHVSEKLVAFTRILSDPAIVVDVDTKELIHGQCVIEDLFNRLADIRRILDERTQNENS